MTEFRLIQISDTHLSPRFPRLLQNFLRVCDHIDAAKPDLVVNTGDLAFDAPVHPDDLAFSRTQHAALTAPWRALPGNHDIGDNPTQTAAPPEHLVSEPQRQAFLAAFGEDRWRFDAAGWSFIGLNALVMNSGLAAEQEQQDWLRSELSRINGRPVALFNHKPLFQIVPEEPELAATSIRYAPVPARHRLIELLRGVDLRLIASGHIHQRRDFTSRGIRQIWAPSTGFVIASDQKQERIGSKEVGLVEYRFQPDGFEIRHLRAPGQIDIDVQAELDALPASMSEA
jgi:3',5'-cyclic AMP phosphodiesterase CpdA